jgi:hypothetical protein
MIHRFINSGIELFGGDVLRLMRELVESAPQTFSTCPARFT